MPQKIVVVGAGVVGISIALELLRQGHCVQVIDRKGVAAEASRGNAGAFAFSDIVPLATPGIMLKAPKWLLDPSGPLSLPPSYAHRIAPWMLRFWRASWQDRYEHSIVAQTALMGLSRKALERQIAGVDGESLIRREGQLQLFEGAREYKASLKTWNLRRTHGIEFELLESARAIAEIQPGIDPRFTHAGYTPQWMNVVDPKTWVEHLAQTFVAQGGAIEKGDIRALENTADGVLLTTSDGETVASKIVVACGAWSHHLARTLGDRIPLETERGYNTTLPDAAFDLRTHLTFGGHGFVVSRINDGVRVGGAVELGGLKMAPNYKRADILLRKAARFLPDLKTEGGKQWMGFRPSMPDSLPVIGISQRAGNVIYAFGHGHLGLTQAAGTAELVGSIINEKAPSISIAPYAPTRF
ncbi:NAD(P)/FAD-dependent oxidoreductase [Octadecabacter ascidiaceicola]|uniref:D-amino acid dehydrogenase small subunit n=1 Tax=Octadecabacter ascidiaceicola TaxID=1655543 RepID=A0A238K357_9RHOB|nr:FAD-dependent oxidoreductase [Octadecabacter ascidiaceicola]SMX36824.1 D-amino acid dehydrogenase small subunit [Octadecabacter ascidiaceicola]